MRVLVGMWPSLGRGLRGCHRTDPCPLAPWPWGCSSLPCFAALRSVGGWRFPSKQNHPGCPCCSGVWTLEPGLGVGMDPRGGGRPRIPSSPLLGDPLVLPVPRVPFLSPAPRALRWGGSLAPAGNSSHIFHLPGGGAAEIICLLCWRSPSRDRRVQRVGGPAPAPAKGIAAPTGPGAASCGLARPKTPGRANPICEG